MERQYEYYDSEHVNESALFYFVQTIFLHKKYCFSSPIELNSLDHPSQLTSMSSITKIIKYTCIE